MLLIKEIQRKHQVMEEDIMMNSFLFDDLIILKLK